MNSIYCVYFIHAGTGRRVFKRAFVDKTAAKIYAIELADRGGSYIVYKVDLFEDLNVTEVFRYV